MFGVNCHLVEAHNKGWMNETALFISQSLLVFLFITWLVLMNSFFLYHFAIIGGTLWLS
jgi:hypothetical protein